MFTIITGGKKRIGYLLNGKRHGNYKVFVNDILTKECVYIHGVINGEHKKTEGNTFIITTYKNGVKDGLCREYVNDKLHIECSYVDGEIDGVMRKWNNQLVLVANFRKGQNHGEYTEWKGNLTRRSYFDYGLQEGKDERWYESGNQKSVCYFVNGVPHGEYTEWWDSIIPIKRCFCTFEYGLKEGECVEFYENGNILSITSYHEDLPHGFFKKYDKEGFITTEGWWYYGGLEEIKEYTKGKCCSVRTFQSSSVTKDRISNLRSFYYY